MVAYYDNGSSVLLCVIVQTIAVVIVIRKRGSAQAGELRGRFLS
jgi:hypothetical protein